MGSCDVTHTVLSAFPDLLGDLFLPLCPYCLCNEMAHVSVGRCCRSGQGRLPLVMTHIQPGALTSYSYPASWGKKEALQEEMDSVLNV